MCSNSQSGSNNLKDCTCNSGSTGQNGDICHKCETGRYKSQAGNETCISCANGTFSNIIGSDTIEICQKCPLFSYSTLGQNCTCNPGWSLGDDGNCNQCVAGKCKSKQSNIQCTNCSQGTHSASIGAVNMTACRPCQLRSNSPLGSDSLDKCQCNSGSTGESWLLCLECARGKYKSEKGNSSCISCETGKYAFLTGATHHNVCKQCPPHSKILLQNNISEDCTCNKVYSAYEQKNCTSIYTISNASLKIIRNDTVNTHTPITTPNYTLTDLTNYSYERMISLELNVSISYMNTRIKQSIRQTVANELSIHIFQIGLLQVQQHVPAKRRLFALEFASVSFIISFLSIPHSKKITSILSLDKINNILIIASNNTVHASKLEILTRYSTDEDTTESDNTIIYIISGGVGGFLLYCQVCSQIKIY